LNIPLLERIKRLIIIAMFSDDYLMERFVLKGGNLLDVVYGVASRASIDLDFSIEGEFAAEETKAIEEKLSRTLKTTFQAEGFEVFDIRFLERPERKRHYAVDFWGGYRVEFKIIAAAKYRELSHDLRALRTGATVVGAKQQKTFTIDISKFEYCTPKSEHDLEGYTVYVYTLEMIVFEKLRAICQQMPEYEEIIPNPGRSARARDFFDIYTVLEHFAIDLATEQNVQLLKNIFEAKRVPLRFLGLIGNYRDYHRQDFRAVQDTVKAGTQLQDFDYYFEYVLRKCEALKSLWVM